MKEPLLPASAAQKKPASGGTSLHRILEGEGTCGRFYNASLTAVIIVNIVSFVASTEPDMEVHKHIFDLIERVTVAMFTVEYRQICLSNEILQIREIQ